jgi:hypothetical protein
MSVMRGLVITALVVGVGIWQLSGEMESGKHFAERNAPVPSSAEAEATLNRFEAALRGKRPLEVCSYLTPRSLREFSIGSGGKDLGNLKGLDAEDFKKGCGVHRDPDERRERPPREH